MDQFGTLIIMLAVSLPMSERHREIVVHRQYGLTKRKAQDVANEFMASNVHLHNTLSAMRARWQVEPEDIDLRAIRKA